MTTDVNGTTAHQRRRTAIESLSLFDALRLLNDYDPGHNMPAWTKAVTANA